jgi:hypothetical protein
MLESLRVGAFPKTPPLINGNIREFAPDTKPRLQQELRRDTFTRSTSFKGEPKWSDDFAIKRLEGIPCACCGKKTLTGAQISEFVNNVVGKTGSALGKELMKYYNYYDPIEKLVVGEIMKYSSINPDYNISQLVKVANAGTRAKLEFEQIRVLGEIGKIGEQLDDKEKTILEKFIKNNMRVIKSVDEEFKRKTFISGLGVIAKDSSNPDVYEKILQEAEKLPTSRVDVGAFFIKYSKDKRSQGEIAYRLLKPCLATTEHVVPRSVNEWGKKDSELHKEDNTANYLVFCDDCNGERAIMPYPELIKRKPDLPNSLQNYLYEVGKKIKSGELRGYDDYPQDIVETVTKATDGLIKLKLPN